MKNVEHGGICYKNLKVVCSCVLIEKMENDEHKVGDIIIPDSKQYANNKIGVGKLLELGEVAKKELQLSEGDYVLYDYYSAYDDSGKNILTKYDNIIMQMTESEANDFMNGTLV